jgi:hypothetical protein
VIFTKKKCEEAKFDQFLYSYDYAYVQLLAVHFLSETLSIVLHIEQTGSIVFTLPAGSSPVRYLFYCFMVHVLPVGTSCVIGSFE